MTCREVDDRIEAIVSGDEAGTDAFRAHLETCLRCAEAVAAARRVEQTLAARIAVRAPADFAGAVVARIRRERWRSEEQVDRLFNLALAAGVVLIVGGVFALMNLSGIAGVMAAGVTAIDQVASRVFLEAAPLVPTYLLAGAFLVTAVLAWWWAERRLSL
jgi:anti-sigma factor RsiW